MMNASPGAFNGATNYKDQSLYILLRNLLRIDSRLDRGGESIKVGTHDFGVL